MFYLVSALKKKQQKSRGFAIRNLKGVERDVKLEATAWNNSTLPKLKGKSQSFAWQYMLVIYEIDLMMYFF